MNALPAEAETLVARIEALLAQAEPLLAQGEHGEEAAYALRETERRYLPDTLKAYLDVPPARRDATAREMLVEQLRLLERATAQRLANLSESAQTALSANGAFLTERFGALESLPEAPTVSDDHAVATTLVRNVLARIESQAGPDPQALIERAAAALGNAFPALAQVRRGGLFGRGPVEAFALNVPRAGDVLQYGIARGGFNNLETSVTRYVRNVKLRTEICDIADWTQGLIEDLGAYVERERSARDALNRLFRENP
ncbi:MAG: hypothetical protein JOY80_09835 [Candidatus Dormibacteraeota bacterium]|nr:hypothetical protein [Candidatus Dormibacteraeota bacterium]